MKNHVDNPKESPVILSFCTGMRGLERGLERAIGPLTVSAYVEIEAFIIYNLVRQMESGVVDAAPVWTDIKTFPSERFHGRINWLLGGYPCQPFSVAGLQQGITDPRHLWPYIERAIDIIKPRGCFFENVANHLNIGYREVRQSLERMGYTVKEGIYTAEEVGAPHERKRLFILAILGNANSYEPGQKREHLEKMLRLQENQRPDLSAAVSGRASLEVAGAESFGKREQNNQINPVTNSRETRKISSDRSIEVDDALGAGLERYARHVNTEGGPERRSQDRSAAAAGFPMGQGNSQYDWEEPRLIKSGMGCTVNGYNFRTDLLRMYGNGVVEQTAEIAFLDLLRKHYED